jgi:hypothetical protein
MKPSLLFNAQLTGATRKTFTIERAPATVFAGGLGVGETLTLQVLSVDEDADEATDAQWLDVKSGGTALALSADTTTLTIEAPGVYALVSSGATAGAIRAGLFGG